MATYVRQVTIEAVVWTGDNARELSAMLGVDVKVSADGVAQFDTGLTPLSEFHPKPGDVVIRDEDGGTVIMPEAMFKASGYKKQRVPKAKPAKVKDA